MSTVYNFYTVSSWNALQLKNDPLKYWLLLEDKEAYIDREYDLSGRRLTEEQVPSLFLRDGEGKCKAFFPSIYDICCMDKFLNSIDVGLSISFNSILHTTEDISEGGNISNCLIPKDNIEVFLSQIKVIDLEYYLKDTATIQMLVEAGHDHGDTEEMMTLLRENLHNLKAIMLETVNDDFGWSTCVG